MYGHTAVVYEATVWYGTYYHSYAIALSLAPCILSLSLSLSLSIPHTRPLIQLSVSQREGKGAHAREHTQALKPWRVPVRRYSCLVRTAHETLRRADHGDRRAVHQRAIADAAAAAVAAAVGPFRHAAATAHLHRQGAPLHPSPHERVVHGAARNVTLHDERVGDANGGPPESLWRGAAA